MDLTNKEWKDNISHGHMVIHITAPPPSQNKYTIRQFDTQSEKKIINGVCTVMENLEKSWKKITS